MVAWPAIPQRGADKSQWPEMYNAFLAAVQTNVDANATAISQLPTSFASVSDARFATVPTIRKTGNYTTQPGVDDGKSIEYDSATAGTFTIAPGHAEGTILDFTQVNTGQLTLAPGSGVTLLNANGLKTRAQYTGLQAKRRPGTTSVLQTANMALRLKADDIVATSGAISAWPESSGNGHPAASQATAGAQPTVVSNVLNGHKVVRFDGGDFLSLTGTALSIAQNKGALSIFIVYNYPTTAAGTKTIFSLSNGVSATGTRAQVYFKDPTGFLGAGGRQLDANTAVFSSSGIAPTAPIAETVTTVFDWTNSDLYQYKNGTQIIGNTSFQAAGNTSNTASLAGTIGANLAGAAEFYVGDIAEILVYNEASSALRANVHTYLQATYGLSMADSTGSGDQWIVQGDATV